MKKFLNVTVNRNDGSVFQNHLKLSEVHLINQILNENKSILIFLDTCTKERFKIIFG
jgi:hypothetical protein